MKIERQGRGRAGFAREQSLRVPGTGLVTLAVGSERTGGAYSLFEIGVLPGDGSYPHVQHREDECLRVLEGRFEFSNNGQVFEAGPGDLIYISKGNLHAYRNVGTEIGRLLAIFTPGGTHERFFEEAALLEQGVPGATSLVEIAALRGIEIVEGPL